MCITCGCESAVHEHEHDHEHDDDHDHEHAHRTRVLRLEVDVLDKSRREAEKNRAWLREHGVLMLNLMSAPGAGKTTLLERTIRELGAELTISVIEGDQATSFDADRIRRAGAASVQVNTGVGCHLDPHMVHHGIADLAPSRGGVVIVENVGNLVCPALFDLGEEERVVLLSVPEGDDKPLKYPHMFAAASIVLLTKVDLLPYVPFDVERFTGAVREVNPRANVLHVSALSATDGSGMSQWLDFVRAGCASARRASEVRA